MNSPPRDPAIFTDYPRIVAHAHKHCLSLSKRLRSEAVVHLRRREEAQPAVVVVVVIPVEVVGAETAPIFERADSVGK